MYISTKCKKCLIKAACRNPCKSVQKRIETIIKLRNSLSTVLINFVIFPLIGYIIVYLYNINRMIEESIMLLTVLILPFTSIILIFGYLNRKIKLASTHFDKYKGVS